MKETMEASEVIGLQFVIPVGAVVVCALLVFVFGFKRVPEPSFEYDSSEEKKKKTRTRKKEKAVPANGHVVNVDPVKVSNKPQQQSEKKESTTKTKPKKAAKEVQQSNEEPLKETEGADVEGWTTAVSRKDKKKKKVGVEESVVINEETPVVEEPSPKAVEEAPLEARGKKVRATRAQKTAKDTPVSTPEQTETTKTKENKDLKEVQLPAKEAQQTAETVSAMNIHVSEVTETSSRKKKNKKKKEASSEAPGHETAEVVDAPNTAQTVTGSREAPSDASYSIEKQLAEAMQEHSVASGDQVTHKISPKKSSKKKTKEPASKAGTGSQVEASHLPEAKAEASSATTAATGMPETDPKPQAVSNPAATTTPSNSQPASSVSFDEIGEWQEAKPVKKRKKPRRDN